MGKRRDPIQVGLPHGLVPNDAGRGDREKLDTDQGTVTNHPKSTSSSRSLASATKVETKRYYFMETPCIVLEPDGHDPSERESYCTVEQYQQTGDDSEGNSKGEESAQAPVTTVWRPVRVRVQTRKFKGKYW